MPLSVFQRAAAKATDDLFRFCEPLDVGDPKAFLAAVIGIFLEFPIEVMEQVADPVRGLPSRARRPYLTDIRKACEEAYEPIARRLERDRAITDTGRLLGPPPAGPKLTVEELEAKLGRPLPKLRRIDGAVRTKSIDEVPTIAARLRQPREDGDPPEAA